MLARFTPWLCASLTTVFAPTLAHAQGFDVDLVDPEEVHSPAGTWTVFIDPSSPRGEGPANYRLSRGKEEVWTGRLDCTLRQVQVGEDGAFAGAAEIGEGALRLMLLGPDGKARFEADPLPLEGAMMHGPSYPYSGGIVVDREHDRVIFRVDHLEDSERIEDWRPVRWSTGEALSIVRPEPPFSRALGISSINALRPIAGLPLLACQWMEASFGQSSRGRASGTRFSVTDFDAHPVWELDLPHDYEAGGNERRADQLWDAGREGGISGIALAHRFEVQFVAEAQCVTFEVSKDDKAPTGWSVREVGRRAHAQEVEDWTVVKQTPALPKLSVEFIGAIQLQAGKPAASEFSGFDIDDRGRTGRVVPIKDKAPRFVLCDPDGAVLSDVELSVPAGEKGFSFASAFWVNADRWFVYTTEEADVQKLRAWWLDLPAGRLTALEDFDCAPIKRGDGTFDGGFVVLTAESKPYTIETTLSRFDAAGKLLWRDREAYGNSEDGLFSAEDVRASPRGEIGVLDNIKHEIQRFDANGKLVSSIELDKLLDHEAEYPTELGVDREGNWVVYDFNGTPPVLRVSREGKLTSTFAPHFADGRVFRPADGIHVAPDGRMWATDGYSLLRLDEFGAVDRVAGETPDLTSLSDVECSFVDSLGRIALADRRTHALHVFDGEGKRVALCNLVPEEVTESTHIGCIAVSSEGNFHVGLGRFELAKYSVFDSAGVHIGSENVGGRSLFQPGKPVKWVISYDNVRLVGADGALQRTITRSPDNKWLYSTAAAGVAASGSLALISRGGVHVYAPNGEPLASFELPDGSGFAGIAFAGKSVLVNNRKKLWSINIATRVVTQATLGAELSEESSTRPFWQQGLGELWIIDEGAKKLLRYHVKS